MGPPSRIGSPMRPALFLISLLAIATSAAAVRWTDLENGRGNNPLSLAFSLSFANRIRGPYALNEAVSEADEFARELRETKVELSTLRKEMRTRRGRSLMKAGPACVGSSMTTADEDASSGRSRGVVVEQNE